MEPQEMKISEKIALTKLPDTLLLLTVPGCLIYVRAFWWALVFPTPQRCAQGR